jgi:acetyl esterase/lipase
MAIKIIRSNAAKWGIKPNKIGIQGSSAGGHLAAMMGVLTSDYVSSADTVSTHPDFMILVSPVVDMGQYAHITSRKNLLGDNPTPELIEKYSVQLQVTSKTASAFIVHAFNDKSVNVKNSLLLYNALLEKNISSSLHIFPQGGHSIALRNNPGSTEQWTSLCESWMIEMGFIPQIATK